MIKRNGGAVRVTVWVPKLGDNRLTWHTCADLPSPLAEENIGTCDDTRAVVRTQGALVARLLTRGRYDGFRLLARAIGSDDLVGSAEWYVSPESGVYFPYPDRLWSACDYGQHNHHQDHDEQPAIITLAA
ncbi:hypothetical protein ACFC3O_31610 [Streptomyces sp. NPDC056007]|uniref:hypothetical protein n=1 Tax=Streptomyces sp. NPDC056007 TaxID=3345678 RepID=UPI0035D66717